MILHGFWFCPVDTWLYPESSFFSEECGLCDKLRSLLRSLESKRLISVWITSVPSSLSWWFFCYYNSLENCMDLSWSYRDIFHLTKARLRNLFKIIPHLPTASAEISEEPFLKFLKALLFDQVDFFGPHLRSFWALTKDFEIRPCL